MTTLMQSTFTLPANWQLRGGTVWTPREKQPEAAKPKPAITMLSGRDAPKAKTKSPYDPTAQIWGTLPYWRRGKSGTMLVAGCFTQALESGREIRLTVGHGGPMLATTADGTLELTDTPWGLRFFSDQLRRGPLLDDVLEKIWSGEWTGISPGGRGDFDDHERGEDWRDVDLVELAVGRAGKIDAARIRVRWCGHDWNQRTLDRLRTESRQKV